MNALAWTVVVAFLLLILFTSRAIVAALSSIDARLQRLETPPAAAEHDALTPVFSAQHVQRSRVRFDEAFALRNQLEQKLYESPTWKARSDNAAPSPEVHEEMRRVCEAIVESECAWREYEFMVVGNLRVAHRGHQGDHVVREWEALLKSTRGLARRATVSPNREKLERVETWLAGWTARLSGAEVATSVTPENVLFLEVWEDKEQWRKR
jgi:hypothetical protein